MYDLENPNRLLSEYVEITSVKSIEIILRAVKIDRETLAHRERIIKISSIRVSTNKLHTVYTRGKIIKAGKFLYRVFSIIVLVRYFYNLREIHKIRRLF